MTVSNFFTGLYDFFRRKKWLLFLLLGGWAVLCTLALMRLTLQEDISSVFPDDPQVQDANTILKNSPFLKRIYMVVKPADTNHINTEHITDAADLVSEKITEYGGRYVSKISCRADDEMAMQLMDMVHNNIPYFLDSADYTRMAAVLHPDSIHRIFDDGYKQLLSPAGFALKNSFVNDPLGITWKGMAKLNVLNVNQRFTMNDGYIMTRDGRNLMIFIEPAGNSTSTSENQKLVTAIDQSIREVKQVYPELDVLYYGAPAMSVANAKQVRKDIFLTVGLAFILLNIILLAYFRKWYTMPLLMMPVVFGAVTALSVLVIVRGAVSSISLGIGSVMLGLILDFSLHAYTHFRENRSARQMVADISPLLMATSGTTVLAFLCLLALQSNLLNELGLFAAISVGSAALFTVIFLPHFLGRAPRQSDRAAPKERNGWKGKMKWVTPLLLLSMFIPVFFIHKVGFETDMDKFSYMPDDLRAAENYLDKISDFKLKNVYVVSKGKNLEEALEEQQSYQQRLDSLKGHQVIDGYTSINQFWPSGSVRSKKQQQWDQFWTNERRQLVISCIEKEASAHKFKQHVFDPFYAWLEHPPVYTDDKALEVIRSLFLADLVQQSDGEVRLITLIRVSEANKPEVYASFSASALIFDGKFIFNKLHEILQADFQLLVWLSTILVFGIILLTFRKPELAVVTMVPLILSWLITLGMMGMTGQQFNIFNVIICTFIFGLGIDYAIFLGSGVLDQYRDNAKSLPVFRISVLLSLITTLLGMGVLIFAHHPALKSIAVVSLTGLFSVAVISFFLLPSLFRFVLYSSRKPRVVVLSFSNLLITVSLLGTYILSGIYLMIAGLVLKVVPRGELLLEKQFSFCMKLVIRAAVTFQRRNVFRIDPALFRNSILIMNHQSMIDLVALGAISGKIRVVTKDWVLKVPVMGNVARMLGFYSMEETTRPDFADKVKKDLANGYTVMFFPEGTRSDDQSVQRFKKGAFLLAEQVGADIVPVVINGSGTAMPPSSLLITSGMCAVKVLPRITVDSTDYPSHYAARSKAVCQMMRQEQFLWRMETENLRYIKNALQPRYRYRSLRVKKAYGSLFDNFTAYQALNKQFTYNDVIGIAGAGYGEVVSYLMFCGPLRSVTVYETDPERIAELKFLQNWHPTIRITSNPEDVWMSRLLVVTGISDKQEFYNLAASSGCKTILAVNSQLLPDEGTNWKIKEENQLFCAERNGVV